MPTTSVVIPALNEAATIAAAVASARRSGAAQVLVVDGGSDDETVERAAAAGADVIECEAGRGRQQRAGAAAATGELILFLHADSRLGSECLRQIDAAIRDSTVRAGAFRQAIEAAGRPYRWLEAGNAWRVRVRGRPYGDQAIFVERQLLEKIGGYPDAPIMEDVILARRLRRHTRIALLPGPVYVSARRWQRRGVVRQTLLNWMLLACFRAGASPHRLASWYHRHDRPE